MHSQQELPDAQIEQFIAPPYPTLPLSFNNKETYSCTTLYIATYGGSSLFLHSVIGKEKFRNRLNFSKAKQQSLADLYQVGDFIYLVFNDHLEPMKEIFLAKFITENIAFQRVIILTSISKTTLREVSKFSLTAISTSWVKQKELVGKFNEGLMGVGADLLQWGQINRIPIICFIGIFGEYQLSSEIIQNIFGALRGNYGLNSSFDISQNVKKYNMKKYAHKIYL